MKKIQTKAAKFGTFVSPTTGNILYVDPTHPSEAHHSPEFDEAEAKIARERGLIEEYEDDAKAKDEGEDDGKAKGGAGEADEGQRINPDSLGAMAAARTADGMADLNGEGEGEGGGDEGGATGLESRQSTAWPDSERVLGGAHGHVQTELNDADQGQVVLGEGVGAQGDDDDSDAAPAPARAPAKKPVPRPSKK